MAINDSVSPQVSAKPEQPKSDSQASAKPEQPKYDDPNNPLYLHHSDQPGVVLVTQLLNDENYPTWSRSMLMALNTKNKEGFVDGTLKKPLHDSSTTLQQWTRCNNLVKSWLLNSISPDIGASIVNNDVASDIWNDLKEQFTHATSVHLFHMEQEIHDCVQGTMTIDAYYTKLKGLWDARDALCSLPSCNCGAAKEMFQFHQHQKTMKFLMGLNDVYTGVRGQILLMDPFPAVNKAFSLITQDEKQMAVSTHALGKTPATDAATFAVHGP
ncbi:uncharacterized protein LOC110772984 [Prunus avium]|uniref:Uncharacterized protein LOC110772984 n=1 Tax=Prunus avium TaxID=42229 RepID=A0A6P5U1E8_PRUAV|nr:uncharacterized protein LOC110772984 [Prunus avium]